MSDEGEEQARRSAARRISRAQRRRDGEPEGPEKAPEAPLRRRRVWLFELARLCVAIAVGLGALALGLVWTGAQP